MSSAVPSRLARVGCLSWAAVLGWACESPTDVSGSWASVVGRWSYSATQASPSSATISGTLQITNQTGPDFSGSLDVVETNAQGAMRGLSGFVSGRAIDSVSVDFDAFVDLAARRHFATLAGDSIRGTWAAFEPGGGASSGAFRGARSSLP